MQTLPRRVTRDRSGIDAGVLEGPGGDLFRSLEGGWKDLYAHSASATAFQSHEWLSSWWECYGERHRARIIVAREGGPRGRLVGLLPLMLEGTGFPRPSAASRKAFPGGRLLFIGTGQTDYLDALLREGYEEEAAAALGEALARTPGWGVADLRDLRPEAAAWRIFGGAVSPSWRGASAVLEAQGCPLIEAKTEAEVLGGVTRSLRKTLKTNANRLRRDGLSFSSAAAGEAEEAGRRLVEMHRESWEGRGISAAHLTARFERFVRLASSRLVRSGLGGIREVRSTDGRTILAHFYVDGPDALGGYLFGATDAATRRYGTGGLYIWDGLEQARLGGKRYLSTLRGVEPFKLRWNPRVAPNRRLLLANPRSGCRGLVGRVAFFALLYGARARARLADHSRSETALAPLLKATAGGAKALQRLLARKGGG